MSLFKAFQKVKNGPINEKIAFWEACKRIAGKEPNYHLGLAKIALDIWAESVREGFAPVINKVAREEFISSFAASGLVDEAINQWEKTGSISLLDYNEFNRLNAEAICRDLNYLTKNADAMTGQPIPQQSPQEIPPQEDQTQGNFETLQTDQKATQQAAQQAANASKIVENMAYLANKVNLPDLANELTNNPAYAEHFASGNSHLPAELQDFFPNSDQVEVFMKKYKQRFPGSIGK